MKIREIISAVIMAGAMLAAPAFAKGGAAGNATLLPGRVIVSAQFTPSIALVGQQVWFTWSGTSPSTCDIEGVPGLESHESSGAYTFTATTSLVAGVSCDNGEGSGGKSARLDVGTLPEVNVAYSPNSIPLKTSSTLTWSSKYATNCTISGAATSLSGSKTVTPAAQGTIITSVTCTNVNGSTTQSAALTVTPEIIPPPKVSVTVSPNYLAGSGTVTVSWTASNATSCNGQLGNSGAFFQFVSQSTPFYVTCIGPGGTGTGSATVLIPVLPYFGAENSAKATPDLTHLGIDLNQGGISFNQVNLDSDQKTVLLVVDVNQQELHILLGEKGNYAEIARTIKGVTNLHEVKAFSIAAAGKKELIQVTIEH